MSDAVRIGKIAFRKKHDITPPRMQRLVKRGVVVVAADGTVDEAAALAVIAANASVHGGHAPGRRIDGVPVALAAASPDLVASAPGPVASDLGAAAPASALAASAPGASDLAGMEEAARHDAAPSGTPAAGKYAGYRADRERISVAMAELKLKETEGQLIRVDAMKAALRDELARVRTRLLAIPAEASDVLAQKRNSAEIQTTLRAFVIDALSELHLDQQPG